MRHETHKGSREKPQINQYESKVFSLRIGNVVHIAKCQTHGKNIARGSKSHANKTKDPTRFWI